jgi:glycosyltransferase involved in cell wall biosynthesis
MPSN